MNAWLVLACEYGQPCGADTPRMQQGARPGPLQRQSYPDYLFHYAELAARLADARELIARCCVTPSIRGIGRSSSVVRGPAPNTAGGAVNFLPGPR
jgi:hypothetical protein